MADRDMVSKAEVLDIYAELYDEFDDAPGVIKVLNKVCDELKSLHPLALLKEQEPVKPKRITVLDYGSMESGLYLCGACRMPIERGDKFCKHCGRKVKTDAKPERSKN